MVPGEVVDAPHTLEEAGPLAQDARRAASNAHMMVGNGACQIGPILPHVCRWHNHIGPEKEDIENTFAEEDMVVEDNRTEHCQGACKDCTHEVHHTEEDTVDYGRPGGLALARFLGTCWPQHTLLVLLAAYAVPPSSSRILSSTQRWQSCISRVALSPSQRAVSSLRRTRFSRVRQGFETPPYSESSGSRL